MDLGHWTYHSEFEPDDWFGFIYRITDLDTNQEYIGKKQFHRHIRVPVKGRKNKKRVRKPAKWREYTSSSTHVNNAIAERGMSSFKFEIVSLHSSKGSLTYGEVKRQIFEDVLCAKKDDGTPKYYNKQVGAVKFIPPIQDEMERKYNKGVLDGK